jgi:hypothetical protein
VASTGAEHSFFDVYLHGHQGTDLKRMEVICDDPSLLKLISINLYSYVSFVISILNSMFCRVDILRN